MDGGAWTEVFRGNALNFTDTITRGWASVAYRVRAYDTRTAYPDPVIRQRMSLHSKPRAISFFIMV